MTTTIVTDGPDSFDTDSSWEQRFGVLNQIEIGAADRAGRSRRPDRLEERHGRSRGRRQARAASRSRPRLDPEHRRRSRAADRRRHAGFGEGTTVLEASGDVRQAAAARLVPRSSRHHGVPARFGARGRGRVRTRRPHLDRRRRRSAAPGRRCSRCSASRELAGGAETEWDVVPQFQVTLSAAPAHHGRRRAADPGTTAANRANELVFYLSGTGTTAGCSKAGSARARTLPLSAHSAPMR